MMPGVLEDEREKEEEEGKCYQHGVESSEDQSNPLN
jgi:hypothetical protein